MARGGAGERGGAGQPALAVIGRVESGLTDPARAPKQRQGAPEAWLAFEPEVADGLGDLRVGDEVIVVTWLHLADRAQLVVHPRDDPSAPLTGVFSTRSADRPNPVGLHPVRILEREGLRFRVDRLEAVDGTAIVDVKPGLGPDGPAAVPWRDFAAAVPELAAFGAGLLTLRPSYLATVRGSGAPRVHPVTPVVGAGGLFVFMEPSSPKVADVRDRGWYALHNGVPDMEGTGGEFSLSGRGRPVEDGPTRAAAAGAAPYDPAERYVLVELLVAEARANGYGDVALPPVVRWRAGRG